MFSSNSIPNERCPSFFQAEWPEVIQLLFY
jgi:hypothetical protein